FGREPGDGNYGIVDPEDLQPLELKDYFLCYLTEQHEPAVRKYVGDHPKYADRAAHYFDHLEIARISKIENPNERFEKLLPFYLRRVTWNPKQEARQAIVACGEIAGARLREVFDDPKHARLRYD